jgi:hypothetical protein
MAANVSAHPGLLGAGPLSVGQGFQPAGCGSILLPIHTSAILCGTPSNHSRQGCRENRQPRWLPYGLTARCIDPPNHIGMHRQRERSFGHILVMVAPSIREPQTGFMPPVPLRRSALVGLQIPTDDVDAGRPHLLEGSFGVA